MMPSMQTCLAQTPGCTGDELGLMCQDASQCTQGKVCCAQWDGTKYAGKATCMDGASCGPPPMHRMLCTFPNGTCPNGTSCMVSLHLGDGRGFCG
jgi:hypothetical protein